MALVFDVGCGRKHPEADGMRRQRIVGGGDGGSGEGDGGSDGGDGGGDGGDGTQCHADGL